jgi:hypothetical protein
MAKARSDEQESDSRQCRWDEPPTNGEVLHPSRAGAVNPADARGKLSDLTREVWRVSGDPPYGGVPTDRLARVGDLTPEVSRGRSSHEKPIRLSGTLTRKGRNGRGSHDRSVATKARTVPRDERGKWSGK